MESNLLGKVGPLEVGVKLRVFVDAEAERFNQWVIGGGMFHTHHGEVCREAAYLSFYWT